MTHTPGLIAAIEFVTGFLAGMCTASAIRLYRELLRERDARKGQPE